MIRDARVLRAGFVPREVEHRDAEVNHLSSVLEPITNGEPADTAIITGPSGTGKRVFRNSSRNDFGKRSSMSRPHTSAVGETTPDSGRSIRFSMTLAPPSTSTGSRHLTTNLSIAFSSTTARERSPSSTRSTSPKIPASSTSFRVSVTQTAEQSPLSICCVSGHHDQ
jgi:hypothetical protein